MADSRLEALDDRTMLRILSEVTADLRETLPTSQGIQSEDDARAAITALVRTAGPDAPADESVLVDPRRTGPAARALLNVLLDDPRSAPIVEEALANPPQEAQKSVELAFAGAILIGALITWLQTSIEITLVNEDGKRSFHFSLRKSATDKATIADVVKSIAKLV